MTRMTPDLKSYLSRGRRRIDQALEAYLAPPATGSTRIAQAMGYSLMAGGKRLRPILCMAGAESAGGDPEAVLPAACALEMIHTYSLIHDDLPAMDNDDLRRGKPTCHREFDEATAILAGDALLTLAFQVLSDPSLTGGPAGFRWMEVIHRVARAAGYRGLIEGQMQDLHAEGLSVEPDALEKMHSLKTGMLIETSVYCGALLGGAGLGALRQLGLYGKKIGLAFQVMDDILNIEGDPAVMGKAAGTDAVLGKSTYPAVLGLQSSREMARTLIDSALHALDGFDNRSDPLRAIAAYIIERDR
jgi:geranylgeranyl diphosphate synthase, type II